MNSPTSNLDEHKSSKQREGGQAHRPEVEPEGPLASQATAYRRLRNNLIRMGLPFSLLATSIFRISIGYLPELIVTNSSGGRFELEGFDISTSNAKVLKGATLGNGSIFIENDDLIGKRKPVD